jgi:drug/metabolite transporter (DMT)-like permease
MPISLFMIIWQTTPFWTSVFAYFISNEPILEREWIAMALCFAGVCLVVYGTSNISEDLEQETSPWGVLIAALCAALYAMANISSRKLSDVHYSLLGFYHPLLGITIFGLYLGTQAIVTESEFTLGPLWMYGVLLLSGLCDFLAFNCRNIAF